MIIIRVVLLIFSVIKQIVETKGDENFDIHKDCGMQTPSFKIMNGEVTAIDEFPWIALLEYKNKIGNSFGFGCSGTLLTNFHVLTTAHCIKEMKERDLELFRIRLGEYNTSSEIDCVEMLGFKDCADPPQDVLVDKWIIHPDHHKHINDVAVIKLSQAVNFSDFVYPICLPSTSKQEEVGDILTAAGWGRTEEEDSSSIKLKVEVPIVPFSICYEQYKSTGTILNNSQHFCAGGVVGKDTCTGDSGGPLMTPRGKEGKWKIIGIISTGNSCGLRDWPAIYMRVSHYKKWILDQIASL